MEPKQQCSGRLTADEAELVACFRLMSEPAREVIIGLCAASIAPPKPTTTRPVRLKIVQRQP